MTKKQRIKEIKDVCEKEILSSEISIPFYEAEIAKCENANEKSSVELKLKQITSALNFNKRFKEYLDNI